MTHNPDNPTIVRGIYRHYKGNLYEVLDIATHSETEQKMVVYRALYGEFGLWVRPLAMFAENVATEEGSRPRFCLEKHFKRKKAACTSIFPCAGCF